MAFNFPPILHFLIVFSLKQTVNQTCLENSLCHQRSVSDTQDCHLATSFTFDTMPDHFVSFQLHLTHKSSKNVCLMGDTVW